MSCSCDHDYPLTNQAFLSPDHEFQVKSFTTSRGLARLGAEDTREMMGFLKINEDGLHEIIGKLTISDGSPNAPSVPREMPHLEEDHGVAFHTHPHHSRRKYNPPTTQDVFIFAVFRTFAKKFKRKRHKHIVFAPKYRYVMTDIGVSDMIERMIQKPSVDPEKYVKQVIAAATQIFKSDSYTTNFLRNFSDSPGLSGVDKCKDNARVSFFQDKQALKRYLKFFKNYGVLVTEHPN